MTIIPSIDLRDGKVVRLRQGDYSQQLNYDVDPIDTARKFRDAGAAWMHIVDLDGAKIGAPTQFDLIGKIIASSGLNVQTGGGIRSTQHVRQLLDAGAQRIVIGTHAIENWDWFAELARDPAMDRRLVLAVDAKDGVIATRGWTHSAGRLAVDVARDVSDWPLAALLYTDVAKDGMMTGPNLHHTRLLAEAGKVPVIASGGVGNIQHIQQLKALPIWGAIVGRSLYDGTLDLSEALRLAGA
jgi:phosphoribosylformimino-5-aminoimidazole carboxamide ribotide isomerase